MAARLFGVLGRGNFSFGRWVVIQGQGCIALAVMAMGSKILVYPSG